MKKVVVGDTVFVKRNILRKEGLYAVKGDGGTVVEIFRPRAQAAREVKAWHVKVRMLSVAHPDGVIKTFRLTSLEKP